jgi:hypothetical protein
MITGHLAAISSCDKTGKMLRRIHMGRNLSRIRQMKPVTGKYTTLPPLAAKRACLLGSTTTPGWHSYSTRVTRPLANIPGSNGAQKPTDEDFCRYYLNIRWVPRPYFVAPWLLTIDIPGLKASLPEELQNDPLSITKDLKAEIDLVERCLRLYYASLHSELQKAGLPERYHQDHPGNAALTCFLHSNTY